MPPLTTAGNPHTCTAHPPHHAPTTVLAQHIAHTPSSFNNVPPHLINITYHLHYQLPAHSNLSAPMPHCFTFTMTSPFTAPPRFNDLTNSDDFTSFAKRRRQRGGGQSSKPHKAELRLGGKPWGRMVLSLQALFGMGICNFKSVCSRIVAPRSLRPPWYFAGHEEERRSQRQEDHDSPRALGQGIESPRD